MLNQASIDAVSNSKFSTHFIQPLYDSYCFSQIPAFIKSTLDLQKIGGGMPQDVFGTLPKSYDKVILFVLDAFGWYFLERYGDKYPCLKRFLEKGSVSKLTSQFPTTTACHMTTIHTGLPVHESGIFEWFYYDPKVDDVIAPLLFAFAGDSERNTLLAHGYSPYSLFPTHTLYMDLKKEGIPSHIFQHENYAASPFSEVAFQGGTVHPYKNFSQALIDLGNLVSTTAEKSYFFIYLDAFDHACHHYGPDADEIHKKADAIFTSLENDFFKYSGRLGNTLFILTADHGQVQINPSTTHYINQEIRGIENYFRLNLQNKPVLFGGSPRDMFLYIKDEYVSEVKGKLETHFKGIAEVYETDELIQRNLFGSTSPSKALTSRMGNIVILPYEGESVWWYEKDRFENDLYGHHGGLTPKETEIPLLLIPI